MTLHRAHPRRHPFQMRGFSMLEVLIAVLVFSLGMIGLAGLLVFAIQSNHVAYLRTQATFIAHNMAASMGANPAGLWGTGGTSDYTTPLLAAGAGTTTTCTTGCDPADLAKHDIEVWSQQVHTFLPKATGSISCSHAGLTFLPTDAQVDMRPPYGGTCTMVLTWNESGAAGGATQASLDTTKQGQKPHTFAWVFQP